MSGGDRQVETPCIDVCVRDADGCCAGCHRTVAEIAAWGTMTDEERAAVMRGLSERH